MLKTTKRIKKINNKKKRGEYGDPTKSHDTCPKDRKSYNISQHTQNKLICTNFPTIPSFFHEMQSMLNNKG